MPIPPATVAEIQRADIQAVANGVAVYGAPEVDETNVATRISLPVFGNHLGVLIESIREIGVLDELVSQLLTQFVACPSVVLNLLKDKGGWE